MLSYREVCSLTVKTKKKPHKPLTVDQIEMLADELVGDNQDQSRLASLLTLADEVEWIALNEPHNVGALLVILRRREMHEWYDTMTMQEAIIQKVRESF